MLHRVSTINNGVLVDSVGDPLHATVPNYRCMYVGIRSFWAFVQCSTRYCAARCVVLLQRFRQYDCQLRELYSHSADADTIQSLRVPPNI